MASSVVTTGSPPNLASLAACLRATMLISAEVRTVRMLGRYSPLQLFIVNVSSDEMYSAREE